MTALIRLASKQGTHITANHIGDKLSPERCHTTKQCKLITKE